MELPLAQAGVNVGADTEVYGGLAVLLPFLEIISPPPAKRNGTNVRSLIPHHQIQIHSPSGGAQAIGNITSPCGGAQ